MSMDALEFLKERKRMCNCYKDCKGCPLYGSNCVIDSAISDEDCGRIAATVEKWSAEHPRKTRQSVFLKQWPNVGLDCRGVIAIDPCDIDTTLYKEGMGCSNGNCGECSRKFWSQEVE